MFTMWCDGSGSLPTFIIYKICQNFITPFTFSHFYRSIIMLRSNSFSVLLSTIILTITWISTCNAAMLRGQHTDTRNLQSGNELRQLVLKNTCKDRLKFHVRYFDGELKYSTFENVRINRNVDIDTKREVTLALVALEDNGVDKFSLQCASGTRGYMKYSDGLCYKFYYSAESAVSCDDSNTGGGGGGGNDTPTCT